MNSTFLGGEKNHVWIPLGTQTLLSEFAMIWKMALQAVVSLHAIFNKDLWQESPWGRACLMGHQPLPAHTSQHPAGSHVWNLMLWGYHLEILNNLSLKLCFVSQVQWDNKDMRWEAGKLGALGVQPLCPYLPRTWQFSATCSLPWVPWEPWKVECNCRLHTSAFFGDPGSGVGRVI